MPELDSFFAAPPDTGAGPGNIRSILYLLRRDLRDLTCPESEEISVSSHLKAPVLAATGINIGFEVLGRIWTGKNDPTQENLIAAYHEILSINKETSRVLLDFRNSLVHGYQLEIHARRGRGIYKYILNTNLTSNDFFERIPLNDINEYKISFWELRRRFLRATSTVYEAVRGNQERRSKFDSVLPYLKPYIMNNGPDLSKSH